MLAAQTGPAAYVRSAAAHATQAHDAAASKSTMKADVLGQPWLLRVTLR
jgi:hypothetical protein